MRVCPVVIYTVDLYRLSGLDQRQYSLGRPGTPALSLSLSLSLEFRLNVSIEVSSLVTCPAEATPGEIEPHPVTLLTREREAVTIARVCPARETDGMVRGSMSTDGSESEFDLLARARDKLKIQQRLIDISWRSLLNHRVSSPDLTSSVTAAASSTSSSLSSANVGSVDGSVLPCSGGMEMRSTIEEDMILLENKLMKGFSRQLIIKHHFMRDTHFSDDEEGFSLEDAAKALDTDLELFLNVVALQPRSVKIILEQELSLDNFFSMSVTDLETLLMRLCVSPEERKRLHQYLECLCFFYDKWERGEKPSASPFERLSSTSSRLSSQGSFDHEAKPESLSSQLSVYAGPPASPCPPLTHASSQTLLTSPPSATHHHPSPLSTPTSATPNSTYQFNHIQQTVALTHSHSSATIGVGASYSPPLLNRSFSTSTSMLLGESETGTTPVQAPVQPGYETARATPQRYRPHRRGHCRSHSNPLANIILSPDLATTSGHAHQSNRTTYSMGGGSFHGNRSPTPPMSAHLPSRCGSQPSMASFSTGSSVNGGSVGGSPSAVTKNRSHPQMRRLLVSQGLPPANENLSPGNSGYISPHSTLEAGSYFTPNRYSDHPVRSYSLASGKPMRSQSSQPMFSREVTSTSMVDLPMTMAVSTDHLDQISEYALQTKKSMSVPRLTFMAVPSEGDRGGSTSVPTSPRTPGNYTPTGHIGHAICHRFSSKTIMTRRMCDFCKKTLLIGVKCKECKYICHKACSLKAPPSCGLPKELMDYVRKQVLLNTSSTASLDSSYVSPSDHHAMRPPMVKSETYDCDTRDIEVVDQEKFMIPELSREPVKGQFSPVLAIKKPRASGENGRLRQLHSTSTLEVPRRHAVLRSTSTSPSSSPPTSPSLTPSSPRSPTDISSYYPYSIPLVMCTDDEEESVDGEISVVDGPRILEEDARSRSSSASSRDSLTDFERVHVDSPRGLRPPPQVVPAQSLPNLLSAIRGRKSTDSSSERGSSVDGYTSDDNAHHHSSRLSRSENHDSLQRTLSTTDSKASTLVNSLPTEPEEDGEDGSYEEGESRPSARVRHRNSVIDEWNIPYDDIKIIELIGRGPVGEVYRGNWHGEVAIKRFHLHASQKQLSRFKAEVSILKRTRHDNLALFMGASLTSPNLAIVTSFCKGHSLYKYIHIWSEPFSVDKSLNIAKQVVTALGYLHARGIVHKNLNTKNIFLDKDKVVITDTGLSSLSDFMSTQIMETTHERRRCAIVPRTKLYYLAPEIMRALSIFPEEQENGDLYPYSEKTDIYAFGTVLYELLTRKFPFVTDSLGLHLDTTSVIFLVGQGERQEVQAREVPKKVKDLIWDCWTLEPRRRYPFSTIWDILMKLARKKTPIARSPSFPTSLSRSTDNLRIL